MSLTPLTTTVVPGLSEGAAAENGINALYVALGTFGFLALLMLGLLMFGAGRDHS